MVSPVSYTKTAWVNGIPPPINATNLNKIEQGLEDLTTRSNACYPKDGTEALTADLDFGGYAGSDIQLFDFDTAIVHPAGSQGRLYFNGTEKYLTMDLRTADPHPQVELGFNMVVRCINKELSPMTKGQAVYVSGADASVVHVKLADASADLTSEETLGFTLESAIAEAEVYVVTSGHIRDIDTTVDSESNAVSDGDAIYLSATVSGGWTVNPPAAPNHFIRLGHVTEDAVSGSICTKVRASIEVDQLNDVSSATPTDGQTLVWNNANGYYEPLAPFVRHDGTVAMTGNLNLNNNVITNIGVAGTDFTPTGGLNLADVLTVSENIVSSHATNAKVRAQYAPAPTNQYGEIVVGPTSSLLKLYQDSNNYAEITVGPTSLEFILESPTSATNFFMTSTSNILTLGVSTSETTIETLSSGITNYTHEAATAVNFKHYSTLNFTPNSTPRLTITDAALDASVPLDMNNNIITGIGAPGTGFTAPGGLNLADTLDMANNAISNVTTVNGQAISVSTIHGTFTDNDHPQYFYMGGASAITADIVKMTKGGNDIYNFETDSLGNWSGLQIKPENTSNGLVWIQAGEGVGNPSYIEVRGDASHIEIEGDTNAPYLSLVSPTSGEMRVSNEDISTNTSKFKVFHNTDSTRYLEYRAGSSTGASGRFRIEDTNTGRYTQLGYGLFKLFDGTNTVDLQPDILSLSGDPAYVDLSESVGNKTLYLGTDNIVHQGDSSNTPYWSITADPTKVSATPYIEMGATDAVPTLYTGRFEYTGDSGGTFKFKPDGTNARFNITDTTIDALVTLNMNGSEITNVDTITDSGDNDRIVLSTSSPNITFLGEGGGSYTPSFNFESANFPGYKTAFFTDSNEAWIFVEPGSQAKGLWMGGTATELNITGFDGLQPLFFDLFTSINFRPNGSSTRFSVTDTDLDMFLGLDMNSNIITNIGAAGTDFTATGGLNLAHNLIFNGGTQAHIGTPTQADALSIIADPISQFLGSNWGAGLLLYGRTHPTEAGQGWFASGTNPGAFLEFYVEDGTDGSTKNVMKITGGSGSLGEILVSNLSALNMGNIPIKNIGAAGTDFTGAGGLTLADILTVSSGGIDITGTSYFKPDGTNDILTIQNVNQNQVIVNAPAGDTARLTVKGTHVTGDNLVYMEAYPTDGAIFYAQSDQGNYGFSFECRADLTKNSLLMWTPDTDQFDIILDNAAQEFNIGFNTTTTFPFNIKKFSSLNIKPDGTNSRFSVTDTDLDMFLGLDMNSNIITNIGAAGTDFTPGGGLTLADILTISSGGANITGDLVVNNAITTGYNELKNSYGNLYDYNDPSTLMNLAVADTFYTVDVFQVGETAGAGYVVGTAGAGGKLTIGASGDGVYKIDYNLYLEARANSTLTVGVFDTGVQRNELICRNSPAQAHPKNVASYSILDPTNQTATAPLGSVGSGAITDLVADDATYMQFNEVGDNPGFVVDYTFTGLIEPEFVEFYGAYDGSATHNQEVLAYDQDQVVSFVTHGGQDYLCYYSHTSTTAGGDDEPGAGAKWKRYWVETIGGPHPAWSGASVSYIGGYIDLKAADGDIPHTGTPGTDPTLEVHRSWIFPSSGTFVDGNGVCTIQIKHDDNSGNAGHDIYFDSLKVCDKISGASLSGSSIITLSSTDYVDLRVASNVASDIVYVQAAKLTITRIST